MSLCILFILLNGSAYVTPACYDSYGFSHNNYDMVTPHTVAFVQQIPHRYEEVLYESPDYYLKYYWGAREKYCENYGYYEAGSWGSWGRGWAFWTPKITRRQKACIKPLHTIEIHYHHVPYRVRNRFKKRLSHHKKYKKTKSHRRSHNRWRKHKRHRLKHTNIKSKRKKRVVRTKRRIKRNSRKR